jgi:hypothetical protein
LANDEGVPVQVVDEIIPQFILRGESGIHRVLLERKRDRHTRVVKIKMTKRDDRGASTHEKNILHGEWCVVERIGRVVFADSFL